MVKHGVGAGGTRNISGNSPVHHVASAAVVLWVDCSLQEVEQLVAQFHGHDAGLITTTRHVAHEVSAGTVVV